MLDNYKMLAKSLSLKNCVIFWSFSQQLTFLRICFRRFSGSFLSSQILNGIPKQQLKSKLAEGLPVRLRQNKIKTGLGNKVLEKTP